MADPMVSCDQCHKKFAIDLKERPLPGGGAEQRFCCPHCRHWYTVAFISAEGIRIRQRMRAVEAEMALLPDNAVLLEELMSLRAQMRSEVREAVERP